VVSKIPVEQLRGDFFFPIGEAFVFLRGRWKSVLGAFIGLLLLQMVLVLIPLSIAWIGKLPGVGTPFLLFTSLFLPVGFFLGVVIVLIAVIFGVSLFFVPAVVATTGADAFETIYQQFAIVWNVPWLTVCYEMILFLLKSIFVPIWAFFCIAGFSIVVFPISLLHTEEMRRALGSANLWVGGALERLAALPYINSLGIFDLSGTGPGTAVFDTMVPAISLTITVFLGVGVVIAYLFSMVSAGNTIIYTILRKRIDGQNLVEPPDPEPQETSR